MLDPKKYKSPIHKIVFDIGDVYIKKMVSEDSDYCDSIEDVNTRLYELYNKSVCDKNGVLLGCTLEEFGQIETDLQKAIVTEIVSLTRTKKKIDSQ